MTQAEFNQVVAAAKKTDDIQNLIDFIKNRYRYDRQLKNSILDKVAFKFATFDGFPFFVNGEMTGNFKQLVTAYRLSSRAENKKAFGNAMHIKVD